MVSYLFHEKISHIYPPDIPNRFDRAGIGMAHIG